MWFARPIVFPGPRATPHVRYSLLFTDAETSKPVQNAKVRLTSPSTNLVAVSDAAGLAKFDVSVSGEILPVSLHVEAEGFEWIDRELKFPLQDYDYSVALKPLGNAVGSLALKARKSYTRVISIGPVPSGRGSEFSQVYEVVSEPPQDGYEIDLESPNTRFSLSGDRTCGGWSECRWGLRTPERVIFQFRLQGHREWLLGGEGFSQGILQVEYKPSTIRLFLHIRPEHAERLKPLIAALKTLPYSNVSVENDFDGGETRLEYFHADLESDAKRIRETICESANEPFGWLPIRPQTSVNNPKHFYGVWIKEPPQ